MTDAADRAPRDIDEVLTTTRAVRRRLDLDRPVERAVVEECLRLALQAPNGSNGQDWSWVLVDDPATKRALAELYRAGMRDHSARDRSAEAAPGPSDPRMSASVLHLAEHLEQVPVLCIPTIGRRYGDTTTFQQASKWGSILPAVWSLMLALRSRGLGSAWTTMGSTTGSGMRPEPSACSRDSRYSSGSPMPDWNAAAVWSPETNVSGVGTAIGWCS